MNTVYFLYIDPIASSLSKVTYYEIMLFANGDSFLSSFPIFMPPPLALLYGLGLPGQCWAEVMIVGNLTWFFI